MSTPRLPADSVSDSDSDSDSDSVSVSVSDSVSVSASVSAPITSSYIAGPALDFAPSVSILALVRSFFLRLTSALPACLVMLVCARVHAAELPVEWSAPAGCASEPEMVQAVRQRLGDASVELTDLAVRGRVEPEAGGWVATLVLRDNEGTEMGERRVHQDAADCRALDGPVALVIAMMLHQHLTKADFFTPPPPPPPAPPPPRLEARRLHHEERAAVPAGHPGLRISWTGAVSCAVSAGVMPAPGIGVAARIDNRIGDVVGVALEVATQNAADVRPLATSAGTVSFSMFEAAAAVHLALLRVSWLELGPMAVVRVGVLSARGAGFDYNQTDTSAMGTVGVGGLASIRVVSNLRLELALEAAIPLVRDQFEIAHGSETVVMQNSPVAARLEGGLAWRLE